MSVRGLLALGLLLAAGLPAAAQAPAPAKPRPDRVFSYNPGGRRDPFKDLFRGDEIRAEKKIVGGLTDLAVDDIVLMGIIKSGGKLEAVISLSGSFPMTLQAGDKLADGYVLSIEETQVVFRKTRDARGIPLAKPRNIVKDIISEAP